LPAEPKLFFITGPSKKWRDLIKKVWEADPLICRTCQREMRIVSLIDEREVVEKMLKFLGLWEQGVRVEPNPFPDYETDPARKRDSTPKLVLPPLISTRIPPWSLPS